MQTSLSRSLKGRLVLSMTVILLPLLLLGLASLWALSSAIRDLAIVADQTRTEIIPTEELSKAILALDGLIGTHSLNDIRGGAL